MQLTDAIALPPAAPPAARASAAPDRRFGAVMEERADDPPPGDAPLAAEPAPEGEPVAAEAAAGEAATAPPPASGPVPAVPVETGEPGGEPAEADPDESAVAEAGIPAWFAIRLPPEPGPAGGPAVGGPPPTVDVAPGPAPAPAAAVVDPGGMAGAPPAAEESAPVAAAPSRPPEAAVVEGLAVSVLAAAIPAPRPAPAPSATAPGARVEAAAPAAAGVEPGAMIAEIRVIPVGEAQSTRADPGPQLPRIALGEAGADMPTGDGLSFDALAGDPMAPLLPAADRAASVSAPAGSPLPAAAEPPRLPLRPVAAALAAHPGEGVELVMAPEELGRVRLVLQPADGGVSVRISADRVETLDLMRRHAGELAGELAAMGFGAASFTFGEDRRGHAPTSPLAFAAGGTPSAVPAGSVASGPALRPVALAGAAGVDLRL